MLSVVVPTHNRARTLAITLESLLVQDVDLPYEVIVVDNNSSDETSAVIRSFKNRAPSRLRGAFEAMQGASAARNAGIGIARGEIIAFTDDDVIAQPTWLQALAATYRARPDAWSVGGKIMLQLPQYTPRWFDPTSPVLTAPLSLMDDGDDTTQLFYPHTIWGANFSVRRDILSRVGLFNTRLGRMGVGLIGSEDNELCYRIHRAGGAIYYCGRAVVTHIVSSTRMTKRYLRRSVYWDGRTTAILFPQDPQRPVWKKVASIGSDIIMKFAHALGHYSVGDRRAFEYELTAWKRLGYLCQTIIDDARMEGQTRSGTRKRTA